MATKYHHVEDSKAMITTAEGDQEVYIFKPRALNIVWGSDSRYWRIPNSQSSSDEEAAELVQVSWLEVTGSVTLKPSSIYQISFKLSFKRDAFGWTGSPVFLLAKVGKNGLYKWKRLKELESLPRTATDVPPITHGSGDSFIIESPANQADMTLYFGLYEVWSGKWKGGLRVHQATVKRLINSN